MGRIKTTAMKRLAKNVIKQNEDSFGPDFSANKKALQEKAPIKSKKIRNMVAGYITRRTKLATKAKEAQKAATEKPPEETEEENE